jgi:hypothetical protein
MKGRSWRLEIDSNQPVVTEHRDDFNQATRAEIERLELPFGFLPEAFTLGELQACCEARLGRRMDKSIFRRCLDELEPLEPVGGEIRTGSFRPAQLYLKR